MNICVIPARGGSKRIPRKNIKDFLGNSYNYTKTENPNQMSVSGSGSVDSLWNNVGSIASYVDTLTFGTKTLSSPFGNTPDQIPLGAKKIVAAVYQI